MLRNVTLTARGGNDLKDVEWTGKNDPYVILELDGQRVETAVDQSGGGNPIWNESFKFVLPLERPDQQAPVLRVRVMNSNRLLPDREIGTGSVALTSFTRGGGSEELRIPITDKMGAPSGWVMVACQLDLGDQTMLGSAAGTTLGTVHTPVGGVPEHALPPASQDALREAQAVAPNLLNAGVPATLTAAPVAGRLNPADPGYGTAL